ncbi:TonB-dependent Receptor Plug Domain protein [compost metagenome]
MKQNITYLYIFLITILMPHMVKAQGLDKIINLPAKGLTGLKIVTAIKEQSAIKFNYGEPINTRLSATIKTSSRQIRVKELLDLLKNACGLTYEISGNYITLSLQPSTKIVPQNPGRISGKIVDSKGEAMPGASVRLVESNKLISSSVDGTYQLIASTGTYTIEVSYISFETKRIADVIVKDGRLTKLDIVLDAASRALNEVVVKSSFKRESIAALYAQQKNSASVTDGISAEQIARTPDNNVGAVLKRVSGITTLDNKYVVVRGLTERYNQAMIDGVTLPNTDMNRRNFSFDLIPTELVSSIVVNKTATPDVSSEFVGGQVIVNTLSIPNENFATFSIGAGGNTQTTGKDFLTAGGRPNSDYFGFDDGRRKMPDNLVSWTVANGQDDPRIEQIDQYGYKTGYAGAIEQSKRFNNNSFRTFKSTGLPAQNYRFTIGRLYDLNEKSGLKMGFTGGLTYRNTQQVNDFETARGLGTIIDYFNKPDSLGRGNAYIFNTTWGAVLNGGIQGEKFKINIRNLYTRTMNEDFYQSKVLSDGQQVFNQVNLVDPVFSGINQHKIEGEKLFGNKGFKVNFSGSYTRLEQEHKDLRNFRYIQLENTLGTFYQRPNVKAIDDMMSIYLGDYRLWSGVTQDDLTWALSGSMPFDFLKDKSVVKGGYTGWYKKRKQNITMASIYGKSQNAPPIGASDYIDKYEDLMSPDRVGYGKDQAYYWLDAGNGDINNADSKYHAGYLMLDQRFFKKLRLVYGVRAENFNLKSAQDAEIRKRERIQQQFPGSVYNSIVPEQTGEKNWYFLPSINSTYSLNAKMNLRASYTQTIIRPDFRETQVTAFPDPLLQALIIGGNIKSTRVKNADLRFEFYPSAEEIISVSGFYKYLDKPVELINETPQANQTVLVYKNQHSAKNYGLEMEIRKSMGFINPGLSNFSVYGNVAVIWSEIKTLIRVNNPEFNPAKPTEAPEKIDVILPLKRPLIGQSPYILNVGLSYLSKYAGANVSFNRSGYRSYIVSTPDMTEFQRPRNLLDLQLSSKFLKQKAELKLNVSNLLNTADEYYNNANSWTAGGALNVDYTRTKGTDNYEAENGDRMRYRVKYGRTYTLQFVYNF